MDYTIIHPGGLKDTPGGVSEFILDVDDKLLKREKKRSISRADVAALCIASLTMGRGKKLSFDCITSEIEDTGTTPKSADLALTDFIAEGRTCSYED